MSEGNQKSWRENKIKFWKETKKIGIEILTALGHRNQDINFLNQKERRSEKIFRKESSRAIKIFQHKK